MAKITNGGFVGEIRNKMADIVYSRNRGGPYTRALVIPTNPKTSYQTAVRSNWSSLNKAWGASLTETNRASWRAFAAAQPPELQLGKGQLLTGLEWFLRLNQNLMLAGGSRMNTPPLRTSLHVPLAFTFTATRTTSTLNVHLTALTPTPGSDDILILWSTKPHSQGITNWNKYLRVFRYLTPTVSLAVTLTTPWATKFGTVAAGAQRLAFGLQILSASSGRTSLRLLQLIDFT